MRKEPRATTSLKVIEIEEMKSREEHEENMQEILRVKKYEEVGCNESQKFRSRLNYYIRL